MSEKALMPVEQKTVLFYEDEITAVLVDKRIYVPLRPLVENLGLDWSGQRQRVQRDAVLADETRTVIVDNPERTEGVTPSVAQREMICLPLDFVSGFLFGVNANRVKSEVRERLIRYQRECYVVLHEAFQTGRLTAEPSPIDDLLTMDSEAAEAYKLALAVVKLAHHQLVLEVTQQEHGRLLTNHTTRLEELEAAIAQPDSLVTQDQASQVSQAVKTVAILQGKQTKRNEFGAVYGELYRKFGITSYKMLPASRFEEAISFLNEWRESLESNTF